MALRDKMEDGEEDKNSKDKTLDNSKNSGILGKPPNKKAPKKVILFSLRIVRSFCSVAGQGKEIIMGAMIKVD
jgi:hypothetical protein